MRLYNKEIRRHKFLCVYATKPYVHHTCTSTTNVCTLLRMYDIVVLGLRAHLRQYLLVSFILCRMYNIVVLGLRAHLRPYLLCQKFCMTNNSSNNGISSLSQALNNTKKWQEVLQSNILRTNSMNFVWSLQWVCLKFEIIDNIILYS